MAKCCLKPCGDLQPVPDSVPYQHDKCYAKSLGNCSSIISGEHWISESILRLLTSDEAVELGGLRWQTDGESQLLGIGSAKSKILCTQHNSILSPLDALAGRFVGALPTFIVRTNPDQRLHLFVGEDFERWMLKTLCGILCSSVIRRKDGSVRAWQPPKPWLEFIFHGVPLMSAPGLFPAGLYICQPPGERMTRSKNRFIELQPLSKGEALYGMSIHINGIHFVLTMYPLAVPLLNDSLFFGATYRPSSLTITEPAAETTLAFQWDSHHRKDLIHVQWL